MAILNNDLLSRFVIIPKDVLFDKELSHTAKRLYFVLASKPNRYKFTVKDVVAELGVRQENYPIYFKELIEAGWLSHGVEPNIKGISKGGRFWRIHDIKYHSDCELIKKELQKDLEDIEDLRYYTTDYPEAPTEEEYNIQREVTSLPFKAGKNETVITYNPELKIYDLNEIISRIKIGSLDYAIKKIRVNRTWYEYIYLGDNVKHVNLTLLEFQELLNRNSSEKIERMVLTLDEWLDRPENEKFLAKTKLKSHREYFKLRSWVEQKVRMEIKKERGEL